MHFTSLVLLSLSATGMMASPVWEGPHPDYVEVYRESSGSGHLVYLAPNGTLTVVDEAAESENTLDARDSLYLPFGTVMPGCRKQLSRECGKDHFARNEICDDLLTDLVGNAGVVIADAPRQICRYGGPQKHDGFCCVSWNKGIHGLTKGDLVPVVTDIAKTCTQNGVAGKVKDIVIKGVCAVVCTSSIGQYCG